MVQTNGFLECVEREFKSSETAVIDTPQGKVVVANQLLVAAYHACDTQQISEKEAWAMYGQLEERMLTASRTQGCIDHFTFFPIPDEKRTDYTFLIETAANYLIKANTGLRVENARRISRYGGVLPIIIK